MRAFKKKHKFGQFKEKTAEEIQQEKERQQQEEAAAKEIFIGSRCEVRVGGAPPRRGVVMFVGKVDLRRCLMLLMSCTIMNCVCIIP